MDETARTPTPGDQPATVEPDDEVMPDGGTASLQGAYPPPTARDLQESADRRRTPPS